MLTPIGDWTGTQDALRAEVDRVTELLRSLGPTGTVAVGQRDAVEVAMHLSQAFVIVPSLARGSIDDTYEVLPGTDRRPSGSPLTDVWDLADTTVVAVWSDPERDPVVLADRIDQRCARFLDEMVGRSPDEPRPWLVEGVTVSLPTLTYHLLNETVVHGRDIAVAGGRRWPVDPHCAALALDGFIMPVVGALGPAMVEPRAAAGLRACFDISVRGGGRYFMVFDDGDLAVEAPSSRRVDCHLSVDPVAFLLVVWGRRSQWHAMSGASSWPGVGGRGWDRACAASSATPDPIPSEPVCRSGALASDLAPSSHGGAGQA
ncbi:MAG: SCP2 sterol-binding domain-containing protein [Acidimicrobiales bacterium]